MSESLKKKESGLRALSFFFNKKMEHPHVKKGNKHQFHWGGLDLQNKRNFSAFFGQTEASVKRPRSASHAREEWKKKHEKTPVPRRTGAIFCVFPTNRGKQEASTKSESRTEGGVQKRKAKPAVPCTYTNCSSYFFPRHWRRLQQTWFYVEATFSPKKWRLQVNICFYASETYKKVIYLNVNKSLQLFWCFKCVCGQVL